jgi:hypothetical protein
MALNMKSPPRPFNIYLCSVLVIVAAGCHALHLDSLDMKKEYSTLRVYLESANGSSSGGSTVLVTRDKIPMVVDPEPFLTEEDLAKATLVDNPDGTYAIRVQFNDHGTLVLDMQTTSSRGRNLVIYSQWPPRGWKEPTNQKEADTAKAAEADPTKPRMKGWLSAVLIRRGITGGSFQFTPDATHEESERIVRGLNNMVKMANKD